MAREATDSDDEQYKILQLKIKMHGVGTGYRRVLIPDHYTFAHLHKLIRLLNNWGDNHLHTFRVPITQYKRTDRTPKIWVTNVRTITAMRAGAMGNWEQEYKYEAEVT